MLVAETAPGDSITIGLSGGIDSVVLLDAMRSLAPKLGLMLDALHVNHGLSPNSGKWEDFCRRHCARRGLPFRAVRVQVAGGGSNVEDEARQARYRAFQAHGARFVALAHNRDDQAETVLMRMLRGAGVRGLAGMPATRMLDGNAGGGSGEPRRVLRPLLTVTREEIRAYAASRRLRWIDDESNADPRYARSFLRVEALPALARHYPGCREALVRTAGHMRDAADLLLSIARADLETVSKDGRIELKRLTALGEPRAANALREALAMQGERPPTTAATLELLRQMLGAGADAQPEIVLEHVAVRRYRGFMVISPRAACTATSEWPSVAWSGACEQRLPDGTLIRARRVVGFGVSRARLASGLVSVRRRRGGEKLKLSAHSPTRTLKNLLQEHEVPPWERAALPLLYCSEQLVWVPAVGVAVGYQAAPGEPAWEFSWDRG